MNALEKVRRLFRRSVGLRAGTDVEGTIDSITKNVRLGGVNIWMLVCSAILASIGLDISSTAVIIGAMLISPLMGPILGVGLGVAIFDRTLLKRAISNLILAAAVGLLTSTAYFFVSPLGQVTPELAARTTPTLLDVGVAFFGGVAGIVAGSRRDKTNAIPGVAIATALMPPLCTAGFGLANYDSKIFLGAFYLFFINAVFISIATYLISVSLRFPRREAVDGETDANVKRFVIGFAVLTIIPSGLIFYNVLERLRIERSVKEFVNTQCRSEDRQPLQWELVDSVQPQLLKVYIVGREISDVERTRLQQVLDSYRIGDLHLKPVQLNVSPDEFKRLNTDVEANLTESVRLLQAVADERAAYIKELQARVDGLAANSEPFQRFIADSRMIMPEISGLQWDVKRKQDEPDAAETRVLMVKFLHEVSSPEKRKILDKLSARARLVLMDDTIEVAELQPATTTE